MSTQVAEYQILAMLHKMSGRWKVMLSQGMPLGCSQRWSDCRVSASVISCGAVLI